MPDEIDNQSPGEPLAQPAAAPIATHGPVEPVGGWPQTPQQLTADVVTLQQQVATLQQEGTALQQQGATLKQELAAVSAQASAMATHTHTYELPPNQSNSLITMVDVKEYVNGDSGFDEYGDMLLHVWNQGSGTPNPPDAEVTGSTSKPITG
jgi:hypothetical protein